MRFESKTVVVTGGSRGIGRAICLAFAKEGANVVFSYSSSDEAAMETEKLCVAAGAEVIAVKGDVTSIDSAKELTQAATKTFGSLDVLVNNAGITRDGIIMTMKEDDFDAVIDTNLKGAFLCIKAASRPMIKQKSGRIINIASVVGIRGNAGQSNYSASKAGLIGMTKSLAKELATRNITVNAVAPGYIATDMTARLEDAARESLLSTIPMMRLGSAEDIATAVLFLASSEASYITGQVLCVDGGMAV